MPATVENPTVCLRAIGWLALVILCVTPQPSLNVLAATGAAAPQEVWVATDHAVGAYNGAEPGGARMADVVRLDDGVYRISKAVMQTGV